jgi:citrate lyase beta subunit
MTTARRSCLSVPGGSARMIAKAAGLNVDEIVLDLEDAVVPAAKGEARELVVEALASDALAGRNVAVRVNGIGTPWFEDDVVGLTAAACPPRSIVVPKVERMDDLALLDSLLDGAVEAVGADASPRVQALIETALGLVNAAEIAAASGRLEALIIGYADLTASLGRPAAAGRDIAAWRWAQEQVLAHGVQAIDGPYLSTSVDAGFRASVDQAREAGYDGKWAIHPGQVQTLNGAFTPSAEEVEHARAVVAALDEAAAGGDGAIAVDGQMLDEALRRGALRTLARATRAERL